MKNSLKCVPSGPINNMSALVQLMASHCSGNMPLCELAWSCLPNVYMHHFASQVTIYHAHVSFLLMPNSLHRQVISNHDTDDVRQEKHAFL